MSQPKLPNQKNLGYLCTFKVVPNNSVCFFGLLCRSYIESCDCCRFYSWARCPGCKVPDQCTRDPSNPNDHSFGSVFSAFARLVCVWRENVGRGMGERELVRGGGVGICWTRCGRRATAARGRTRGRERGGRGVL
eukprot:g68733.t1